MEGQHADSWAALGSCKSLVTLHMDSIFYGDISFGRAMFQLKHTLQSSPIKALNMSGRSPCFYHLIASSNLGLASHPSGSIFTHAIRLLDVSGIQELDDHAVDTICAQCPNLLALNLSKTNVHSPGT